MTTFTITLTPDELNALGTVVYDSLDDLKLEASDEGGDLDPSGRRFDVVALRSVLLKLRRAEGEDVEARDAARADADGLAAALLEIASDLDDGDRPAIRASRAKAIAREALRKR